MISERASDRCAETMATLEQETRKRFDIVVMVQVMGPFLPEARCQRYPCWINRSVIPFQWDYRLQYINLKPTPLELAESVGMMRVLEHGDKVRMVPIKHETYAVDTQEDLNRVERMIMQESNDAK